MNDISQEIKALCDRVRQISYDVHVYHGNGYGEKVYENALVHRLRREGIQVFQQYPVKVHDEDGTLIGDFSADIVVQNALLVELKAVKKLLVEHEAQLIGYLKASAIKDGLLINFGSYKFEIRKYFWRDTAENAKDSKGSYTAKSAENA
jgi:GxxExxY protein